MSHCTKTRPVQVRECAAHGGWRAWTACHGGAIATRPAERFCSHDHHATGRAQRLEESRQKGRDAAASARVQSIYKERARVARSSLRRSYDLVAFTKITDVSYVQTKSYASLEADGHGV